MTPPDDPLEPLRKTISIAVVEDDAASRRSVVAAIGQAPDMVVAWEASSLEEGVRKLDQPVDVLLLDLGLPDGSGLDLIAKTLEAHPACLIMVSTVFGDEKNLFEAIGAGALGYMLKDVSSQDLVREIRNLYDGGSPINPMLARKLLLNQTRNPTPRAAAPSERPKEADEIGLSPRESEVLQWVAKGHTLDEVAVKLGITRHTARSFIRRIYQKLNVNTRAEAVKRAFEQGLLR